MSVRRLAVLLVPLALAACPNVKQHPLPDTLVFATFNTDVGVVPLPNDLALYGAGALPAGMQKELLQAFVAAGGFPGDQEVPVTITIRAAHLKADGSGYEPADVEDVDPATVNASTVAIVRVDGTPTTLAPEFGSFTKTPTPADHPLFGGMKIGTLSIRVKAAADGSRRWASGPNGGRYVVALRGGSAGVKTVSGRAVSPDLPIALIAANKSLLYKENQPIGGLDPTQAAKLEDLRANYAERRSWCGTAVGWLPAAVTTTTNPCVAPTTPAVPSEDAYAAVDRVFPHAELSSIQTFGVDPSTTVRPLTDTGSGQLPLPSDFMLDPLRTDPVTGRHLVREIPAFGPAAAGLATLDGFSTTGMLLAPLSGPVKAATIDLHSVFLFDVTSGSPVTVPDLARAAGGGNPFAARYVLQPSALNSTVSGLDVTTAIGLQPGVPAPVPGVGLVPIPPLDEKHQYVAVVTDRVKDLADQPIAPSTLAKIVFRFTSPLVVDGKSTVPGVSDGDAAALDALRTLLAPILDNIGALTQESLTRDDVVLAYPVTLQTVTDVTTSLSAAPYDPTVTALFTTSDVGPFGAGTFPRDLAQFPDVDVFLQGKIFSLNAINPANGALNPDNTKWAPAQLPVLVAVPKAAAVPPCGASGPPFCAPLAVFHHGIGDSRFMMLGAANALAKRGFVVAAIDMPLHGDRSYCMQNSECETASGGQGTCTPQQALAGQGDAIPPGTCGAGEHLTFRTSDLQPVASGNYFLSANFFRIRDAFRQNALDQSALVLAVAPPQTPAAGANPLFDQLAAKGIVVDPRHVYSVGHSLGGMAATQLLATNPRFERGVLTPTGATLVDVFASAPSYHDQFCALFGSLGIPCDQIGKDPVVTANYLKTLIIAKWILDPAEALNYAAHVNHKLPSKLTSPLGAAAHADTSVLGQLANCDATIPDTFGAELLGVGQIPSSLYVTAGTPPAEVAPLCANPAAGPVPHGTFVDSVFVQPPIGDKMRADAAAYLFDLTAPAAQVQLP